jgi:hypothetical protein
VAILAEPAQADEDVSAAQAAAVASHPVDRQILGRKDPASAGTQRGDLP